MLDDLQLDQITDPQARELIQRLLNLIETLSAEQDRLKAENQQLRDENARLKGTPSRPKGPLGKSPAQDLSSEQERRVPRGRVRQPKNDQIQIKG
jgi:cell division protein FtsB